MRINHNIAALNTYNRLNSNTTTGTKSLEKLSSGLRINRAGDDAAGLAISEKMRAQIRGLGQASRNSQDAISLIQTAEGALNETQSILQRMRELAVQSGNDTNVAIDRTQIQKEINQLTSEINRIGNSTEFNTMKLLDGSKSKIVTSSSVTLKGGSVTMETALNLNSSVGTLRDSLGSGVTIAAGDYLTAANSTVSSIRLSFSTAGPVRQLTVELLAGTVVTGNVYTTLDTLTANAIGDFEYNNAGVSFTIKASSVATIANNDSVQLGSSAAGSRVITQSGTYATRSNYISAGNSNAATISNLTVTANNDNKNARWITIAASGAAATSSGQITVRTYTDSGLLTVLTNDTYTYSAGTTEKAINLHGISFTVTGLGTLSAAGSITSSITLTSLGTTATASAWNDQSLKFQVGANQNQSVSMDINDMRAKSIDVSSTAAGSQSVTLSDGSTMTAAFVTAKSVTDGTNSTSVEYALDVSTATNAAAAITVINDAINEVSDQRSQLGATQNRLEHTISNLDTSAENLQSSESRIRDVDMAKEMMEFTKNNILTQAAQAMLAQANQQPQGVLQLLR